MFCCVFLSSFKLRNFSYYLRELIEGGLDDLEGYYLSERVMERIRKGVEKIYGLNEVEQGLDPILLT